MPAPLHQTRGELPGAASAPLGDRYAPSDQPRCGKQCEGCSDAPCYSPCTLPVGHTVGCCCDEHQRLRLAEMTGQGDGGPTGDPTRCGYSPEIPPEVAKLDASLSLISERLADLVLETKATEKPELTWIRVLDLLPEGFQPELDVILEEVPDDAPAEWFTSPAYKRADDRTLAWYQQRWVEGIVAIEGLVQEALVASPSLQVPYLAWLERGYDLPSDLRRACALAVVEIPGFCAALFPADEARCRSASEPLLACFEPLSKQLARRYPPTSNLDGWEFGIPPAIHTLLSDIKKAYTVGQHSAASDTVDQLEAGNSQGGRVEVRWTADFKQDLEDSEALFVLSLLSLAGPGENV